MHWDYQGKRIVVGEDGRFHVDDETIEEGRHNPSYDTLEAAKAYVDRITVKPRAQLGFKVFSVSSFPKEKVEGTLTKLHGATKNPIVKGKQTMATLYFDTPSSRLCLERYKNALKELKDAELDLKAFAVPIAAWNERNLPVEEIEERIRARAAEFGLDSPAMKDA